MTAPLTAEPADGVMPFAAFFEAIHGHSPFPWQERAAEQLAQRRVFPVDVPTGLGKSALIDAAVWAAASGAWRRIAYVVDRRIVVDAVHQRALRIQHMLTNTKHPALAQLAQRLGDLQIVRLRGGVFGDDDWVLYPERLSIVLTTVDQIGSRLLFRGYGVSSRRWPMHAAFFANDTLAIVDEAHLSRPFLQTAERLREAGADLAVLPMSATLQTEDAAPLRLEADDLLLPAVQQRLHASKPVALLEIEGPDAKFIEALSRRAQQYLAAPHIRKVVVIVNRVNSARACHQALLKRGLPCALLIGRNRPLARDRQLQGLLPQLEATRQRASDDSPLVVVATQTIEVGADFDFDVLVSESAPLSALRQRLGRLNRLGLQPRSPATVMHRVTKKDDAVYGAALNTTWRWLLDHGGADKLVDFGLSAMDRLLAVHPPPEEAQKHAATLLPIHIDLLAQTGPMAPEIDIAAWLHGPSDRAPDVTLVWRDDLDETQPETWAHAVSLLPPLQRESLALPIGSVRKWLRGAGGKGNGDNDLSDLDSPTAADMPRSTSSRSLLRWRGAEACDLIDEQDVRPGDTLVVPASYGGCDEWGWAPDSAAPVEDLADAALIEAGQPRPIVARLVSGHWLAWGVDGAELQARVDAIQQLEAEAAASEEDFGAQLQDARAALRARAKASAHPLLRQLRAPRIEPHPNGLVLRNRGIEEIEGAIETGRAVGLQTHNRDVARWAARLAAAHPEREPIVQAAGVHDDGKAELRMQALLHGSLLAAQAGPLLAKSARRRWADQRAAWQQAKVPRGFRHEFASLHYSPQADPLVRHLVASHHGHARPWGPRCADPDTAGADLLDLDQQWLRAWADLVHAHGPWRLAEMEWLLRAADARASMEEAQAEDGDDHEHD